jgi:prophage regulatory protein
MPTTSETCLSRLPQIKQRTGLSRSSIYAKIGRGEFPSPIRLGPRAVGWLDSEIEAWITQRVQASRGGLSEDSLRPTPEGVRLT